MEKFLKTKKIFKIIREPDPPFQIERREDPDYKYFRRSPDSFSNKETSNEERKNIFKELEDEEQPKEPIEEYKEGINQNNEEKKDDNKPKRK